MLAVIPDWPTDLECKITRPLYYQEKTECLKYWFFTNLPTVSWCQCCFTPFLGEVQWVNHRYVPHASSFGEGTCKPGYTDLQTRNTGECHVHPVWRPSGDLRFLQHKERNHQLLWCMVLSFSCTLFKCNKDVMFVSKDSLHSIPSNIPYSLCQGQSVSNTYVTMFCPVTAAL